MNNIRYRRDLWQLIGNLPGGAVEIGVAEGYFSADMLRWPIQLPYVFMVDRWATVSTQKGDASNSQEWHDKNYQAAVDRVKEFAGRAIILRGDSVQMAERISNGSLALVYVDGDHSYEGVSADIQAWMPKLVDGGVMAFHDYENTNYGVKAAVRDFCNKTLKQIYLLPEDKPEDAGAWFRK